MKADKFLQKHNGIIYDALNDYMKWFDDDEDIHKSCQEAIDDLGEVK